MDLVQELPPEIEQDAPGLVPVFTSANVHEAHIVRGLLEANGITAFVFDDQLSSLMPHYTNAVGGVKVVVDRKQASLARQALEDYRAGEGLDPSSGALSPWS